jgi:hypothetical protein
VTTYNDFAISLILEETGLKSKTFIFSLFDDICFYFSQFVVNQTYEITCVATEGHPTGIPVFANLEDENGTSIRLFPHSLKNKFYSEMSTR